MSDPSSPSFSSGLSASQLESVLRLQELSDIDDLDVCRALLESNEWNLDDTIAEQQRGQEAVRPHAQQEGQGDGREAVSVRVPRASNARSSWLHSLLTSPWRLFTRVYEWLLTFTGFVAIGNEVTATEDNDFHLCFNANFPNFSLTDYTLNNCSYREAIDKARRELRFLLVYLHSPRHQDSVDFCARFLSSPSSVLLSMVREHNLLFFCRSIHSIEGQRASQALREATYPFLGLVVLRQNRMMLVGRREGMQQMDNLESDLQAMISDNEAFVVAARADREERERTQTLRAEQDAAFQETLRQDQERERLKREQEEEEQRQRDAELQAELDEQQRKAERQRLRVVYADRVPDEPDEGGSQSCVRIVLKLPSGERLERRFDSNQSMEGLYYFVFCHASAPDEFEIWSHFPRRRIECEPKDESGKQVETFEQAGLKGSAVLFVNDLEE